MASEKGGSGVGATIVNAIKTPLGMAATVLVVLVAASVGSEVLPHAFHNMLCNTFGSEISCIRRDNIKAQAEARAQASLLGITRTPDRRGDFTVGGELNRRMHGEPQPQPRRRQPVVVHGVDRTPPSCAGELRRDEAKGAWVCRVYH